MILEAVKTIKSVSLEPPTLKDASLRKLFVFSSYRTNPEGETSAKGALSKNEKPVVVAGINSRNGILSVVLNISVPLRKIENRINIGKVLGFMD